MDELRNDVSASEGALQQYREQKDSVSLGDQQNIVVQKLAQLNAAVTTARTERLDKADPLSSSSSAIQESGAAARYLLADSVQCVHPGTEGRAGDACSGSGRSWRNGSASFIPT